MPRKNFFKSTPFYILIVLAILGFFIIYPLIQLFNDTREDVPILVYHDIMVESNERLNLSTQEFAEQMKYLKDEEYSVITIDQLLDSWRNGSELPKNPVVLTFDGGYLGVFERAFPILQEYQYPATVFIATNAIGTHPRYMDWEQVRLIQSSGLIDIESNTLNRRAITKLGSKNIQRYALTDSKQAIEWNLHSPVKYIAYPLGVYDLETLQLSRNAGYRAGFTIAYGFAHKNPNAFVFDRVPIFENGSLTMLRFKIRLKYAPLVQQMKSLRDVFESGGYEFLSNFIPVP